MGEARTIRGETRWLYRPREPALRTGERLRVGVAEVVDALLDVVFVEVTAPGHDLAGATRRLQEAGLKVSDRGADEGALAFLVVRAEAEEVLRALGEADESAGFSTEPTATALDPVPAPRLARPARRLTFPLEDATDPPTWEEDPITRPTPAGGGAPPAVVAAVPLGLAAAMVLAALGAALVGLAVTAWQRGSEAAVAVNTPGVPGRAAAAEADTPGGATAGTDPAAGVPGPGVPVAGELAGEAGNGGAAIVGVAGAGTTGADPVAAAVAPAASGSVAAGSVATGAAAPGAAPAVASARGGAPGSAAAGSATRDPGAAAARPPAGGEADAEADTTRWASIEAPRSEVAVSFGTRGGFGYRLKVDGGPAAELPVRGLKLRPGRHEVWVGSVDGARVETFVIEVPDAPSASWVCDWARATNPCREAGG